METRANYFLVGLFVIVFTLGFLGFAIWLAKFQVGANLTGYDILYRGSVTGLKEGGPVRFSGVKVGEVVAIRLNPDDPAEVQITITVDSVTPVRADTKASLEFEGLTGGRYILLHGGSPEAPPLVAAEKGARPVIPARPSSLEQVIEGAPEVLAAANLLLARTTAFLSEENRVNVARLIDNLAKLSDTFAGGQDEIERLIVDSGQTMENLRDASEALEGMALALSRDSQRLTMQAELTLASIESLTGNTDAAISGIARDLGGLIATLDSTGRSLDGAIGEVHALVAENREPVRDFASTGLYEFSALLTEARALIRELKNVTTEVQRDPARFFFGDRQQGFEPVK